VLTQKTFKRLYSKGDVSWSVNNRSGKQNNVVILSVNWLARWDDFRTLRWLKQIEVTEVTKLMDNVRTYFVDISPKLHQSSSLKEKLPPSKPVPSQF